MPILGCSDDKDHGQDGVTGSRLRKSESIVKQLFPVIARSDSDEAIHLSACCAMDCFAEPVIGRAFARPVGSQWR